MKVFHPMCRRICNVLRGGFVKFESAKNSNSYHETSVSGRSRRHEGQEASLGLLVCSSSSHGDPAIAFTNRESRTNPLTDRSNMLIWLLNQSRLLQTAFYKLQIRRGHYTSCSLRQSPRVSRSPETKTLHWLRSSQPRSPFSWPRRRCHDGAITQV